MAEEIQVRPASAVAVVLDVPRRWVVDGAVLGAVAGGSSTALLMMLEPAGDAFPITALLCLSGGLTGAAVGAPLRRTLDNLRRRLSLPTLAVLMPIVGAAWGASVVVLTFLGAVMTLPGVSSDWVEVMLILSGLLGAPVGALLFGLLWLPYAISAVMRLPRWPLVLTTAAASPVIGYLWFRLIHDLL